MLRFRAPGRILPAETLLARALPEGSPSARRALLAEGSLRVGQPGPRGPRPQAPLAPGSRVPPGTLLFLDLADPEAEARLAGGESASAPRAPERDSESVWLALAPAPAWPEARRRLAGPSGTPGAAAVTLRATSERGGVARLELRLEGGAGLDAARALAADLRAPLLGDLRHGGVLVEGGLQLVRSEEDPPPFPDEPVFPADAAAGPDQGVLAISGATRRALDAGHPWVRPDAQTGDPGRFRPGALVRLAPPRGPAWGLARVEGPGPVAARAWASGVSRAREAPSVESRVHAALGRRTKLLEAAAAGRTDAFRLVHGEADGLPGLAVDRLGPVLRLLLTGASALPLRTRVVDALLGQLAALEPALCAGSPDAGPALAVIEVLHLRPPPRATLRAIRVLRGDPPPGPYPVREDGLVFRVDPGLGAPARPRPGVGLFLDQRANRARVRARTRPGGRYLNLFAHTGAFSVALLAAGAGEVVSVDLSAPYLEELEANLKVNRELLARAGGTGASASAPAAPRAFDGVHRPVRGDARRFVEGLAPGARFDGIVLDPPTAAAAGRRFWSVAQGQGRLVAALLRHVAPGGWLLVCRNDRRGRGTLAGRVAALAREAGVRLAGVEPAPPGEDFPALPGFPEGDPFEGVLAVRESED